MSRKYQTKHNWQAALGALALGLGAIGFCPPSEAISITSSSVTAASDRTQYSFKLAQVGVRVPMNPPTPLNITPPPGTHIPLPVNSYHHPRRNYHKYRGNSRRDYSRYRRYRGYGRHEPYYGDRHYRRTRRGRYHNRNRSVIIIKPSTHGSYGNNGSYIRVIRK